MMRTTSKTSFLSHLRFPTPAEHLVGALTRARTGVVEIGAMAVVMTAGDDDAVRDRAARGLEDAAKSYRTAIEEASALDVERGMDTSLMLDLATARRFAAAPTCSAECDAALDRAAAVALLFEARDTVVPAIERITAHVLHDAATHQNGVVDRLRDRASDLEVLFREMEMVGRTIKLISFNAADEAARAGGTPGRVFSVIAIEIRRLEAQAADLLRRARARLDE